MNDTKSVIIYGLLDQFHWHRFISTANPLSLPTGRGERKREQFPSECKIALDRLDRIERNFYIIHKQNIPYTLRTHAHEHEYKLMGSNNLPAHTIHVCIMYT